MFTYLNSLKKNIINKTIQLPSTFNSIDAQVTLFLLVKRRNADQSTLCN